MDDNSNFFRSLKVEFSLRNLYFAIRHFIFRLPVFAANIDIFHDKSDYTVLVTCIYECIMINYINVPQMSKRYHDDQSYLHLISKFKMRFHIYQWTWMIPYEGGCSSHIEWAIFTQSGQVGRWAKSTFSERGSLKIERSAHLPTCPGGQFLPTLQAGAAR